MRIFSFFILLLFNNFKVQASETILKECNEFEENVLSKAVIEDENKEPYYIFVKDEKLALELINKFDAKKLGLEFNFKNRQQLISSCQGSNFVDKDSILYCETAFPVYNYFKGLIYGLKNFSWSPETKSAGLKKMWSYLDEVRHNERSLLELLMSMQLIEFLAKEDLTKAVAKPDIKKLIEDAEKANDGLRKLSKTLKLNDQIAKCDDLKKSIGAEEKVVEEFTKKLNQIIKDVNLH